MPTHVTESRLIPLSQIELNPDQPRKSMDPVALEDLKASIQERGLINPVSVQALEGGGFRLIAGERRTRACQALGWTDIDARIWPSNLPAQEKELLALVENLQRADLNPIEIARGYEVLSKSPHNLEQGAIAAKLGITDSSRVSRYLALLDFPEEIQDRLARGKITEGHCRFIRKLINKSAQIEIAKKADAAAWSVQDTEREVNKLLAKKPKRKSREVGFTPDPLEAFWTELRSDPSLPGHSLWEATWKSNRVPGRTAFGWNVWVTTPTLAPARELAAWFRGVSDALERHADAINEPKDFAKDVINNIARVVDKGDLEKFMTQKLRVPKTPAEEAEVMALTPQGPTAVYTWFYGATSPTTQFMAGKSWQDLQVPDPQAEVQTIIEAMRLVSATDS